MLPHPASDDVQVTGDSQVFNIFEDGNGERQTVYVGSFDDLKTQDIKQLGGIPVQQLEKAFGQSFDGTITGFVDRASKGQTPQLADPVSCPHFPLLLWNVSAFCNTDKQQLPPFAASRQNYKACLLV